MTTELEEGEALEGRSKKRPRQRTVHFAKRRTLRFGEDEEQAVHEVRVALATATGRSIEKVSFSEALRLMILDKPGTADVQARALVIERSGSAVVTPGSGAAPRDEVMEKLAEDLSRLRSHSSAIGGNVKQVARTMSSGAQIQDAEIKAALVGAASLRTFAEKIEPRLFRADLSGVAGQLEDELGTLRSAVYPVGDAVNQVAKNLNIGLWVSDDDIHAAMAGAASLSAVVDDVESRLLPLLVV